jgi:putative ABC transport system substrate-binding protein
MKIKTIKPKTKIFIICILLLVIVVIAAGVFWLYPFKKVYHVGIISGTDFFEGTDQGFRDKMAELGYKEGENIVYDMQKTNNDMSEANKMIENFINKKVDLIFAFPTNVAVLAKDFGRSTNIPLIFGDATVEGSGLVKDVNYPGDNVTGVRQATMETTIKRFELMHSLVPDAKSYLIFYQNNFPIVISQLRELVILANEYGIELVLQPVDSTKDINLYLQNQDKKQKLDFDAVLTIIEPVAVLPESSKLLAIFADTHNIPFGGAPLSGDYQNLFGVSIDSSVAGKQAGVLADKILKGTFAGSIPVVTSDSYIQINLKIAKILGLTVNDSLLSQANKIIQ